MGFCRTNLFKRLESSGPAFMQSLERHVLRNLLVLHAVEHGLEVPIGTQSADDLDTRQTDADRSAARLRFDDADADEAAPSRRRLHGRRLSTEAPRRPTRVWPARGAAATIGCGPTCSSQTLASRPARRCAGAAWCACANAGAWNPNRDTKLTSTSRTVADPRPPAGQSAGVLPVRSTRWTT